LRPVLLLLVVLAAAPADAAPRRRAGRVVRIERSRVIEPDPVRMCMVISLEEGKITCYGQTPPPAGARLALVSDGGLRGTATVRASSPSSYDVCRLGSAHDVTVDLDGTPAQSSPASLIVAVQGVTLGDGARLLLTPQVASPGRRDDQVWTGVDRDGDTTPDMLTTVGECSAEIHPLPVPSGGQRVQPLCIDYWLDERGGWSRAGRDIFYQCL
jgi:hypothetical protein